MKMLGLIGSDTVEIDVEELLLMMIFSFHSALLVLISIFSHLVRIRDLLRDSPRISDNHLTAVSRIALVQHVIWSPMIRLDTAALNYKHFRAPTNQTSSFRLTDYSASTERIYLDGHNSLKIC